MNTDDQLIIDHTRQWLEKAVIGLNLCPFAKAPYIKNRVRIVVSHAKHTDGFLEDLDRELLYLAETPAEAVETTLLIHPDLYSDFFAFNDILHFADQAVLDNDLEGIIQIAPFHPQFQFADTEPDDISNYTNRSPYPTLHLIREESIAKAAEAIPVGRNGARRLAETRPATNRKRIATTSTRLNNTTMVTRTLFWIAGAVSLLLGIIGIFLPVLPTTPFVLLAAACWARASPRFHHWLKQHRRFGPIIENWETRRAIPRRAKYLAWGMMTISCTIMFWRFPNQLWIGITASAICLASGLWMATLPDA